MDFKSLWFWKKQLVSDRWAEVYAYSTEEYKHPSIVISLDGECPTQAEPVWYSSIDDEENLLIHFNDPEVMGGVPPLWYVIKETNRPHPNGPEIPCVFVFAFYGDDFPNGTIVKEEDLIKNGFISHSERVGHIVWFRQGSKLQQITVAEKWRRKRVSLALFGVADLVIISGNYGKLLTGGDITTEDGEKLREVWGHSNRVTPRIGSVSQEMIEPI
jgi:hypothetical protein